MKPWLVLKTFEYILIAEKESALQLRINTNVATSDESVEVLDGPHVCHI